MSDFIEGEAVSGDERPARAPPANRTARRFVFTCYSVETPLVFTSDTVRYAVWQREVCPTTGRRHFQGYIVMMKSVRFSAVKALLPSGAHVEIANGDDESNEKYCTKEDTRDVDGGPFRFGTRETVGRGKRSDLIAVKEMLDKGASELEIADAHFAAWSHGYRAFERYKRLKETPRAWLMNCEVHVGVPGSGKSRQCFDRFPTGYWKQRSMWWCGYERHESVVFDDFYGWLPYDLILRICDRYPLNVESKGGQINFCAKTVIFTSNLPFTEWYDWTKVKGDQRAFIRRISRWVCYGTNGIIYDGVNYEEFMDKYSNRFLAEAIALPIANEGSDVNPISIE